MSLVSCGEPQSSNTPPQKVSGVSTPVPCVLKVITFKSLFPACPAIEKNRQGGSTE